MSGQTGMMRAVVARRPGGPDVLEIDMRPRPVPAEGQILVRVEAAGVNRPDILQRMGNYPAPPGASDALGLEVAGEVIARGAHAARYAEGARVTALVPGGGYADYCVVDERNALPIPAGLTAIEAAAIPETFFTVWTNVFDRGALKTGETLLVHGGTSGIGTTAIALAKAFGARVVATAGSDDKARQCERLGADAGVNYRTRGLRRADVGGDRWARRRCHPRHGRRGLCRPQLRSRGGGRADRADRLSARAEGDDRPAAAHAEAPCPYRLDAPRPFAGGEGGNRGRPPGKGVAAPRGGALQADHRFGVSARRCCKCAPRAWKARPMSARSF